MTIDRERLRFVSVGELLGTDAPALRIPDFQRPYSWTPRIAAQLFTDVADALADRPEHPYVMGTVILLKRPEDTHYEVVDGQQRLLTLHLLRALLRREPQEFRAEGNTPVHAVHRELARLVAALRQDEKRLTEYWSFLDSRAQVLQIVTDDEDEAFQFFDSQNFRGKPLRPHDLLKAFHLREMAESSGAEQRAVVEQWEQADENALDRLFGTYLARIHWWSRNLPAHEFTDDDLDLFKGVGRATRRLPGAEYHRAAKAVLPGLQEWAHPAADPAALRDLRRARHQLDAPVAAGKSFFDFAAFMLEESDRLDEELYAPFTGNDTSEQAIEALRDSPRFRYCRELYVAAALYYTNKYSEADLPLARRRLFRWAHAPRLAYERLGWRSTDNYARGRPAQIDGLSSFNLFSIIRDTLDPRDVPLADVSTPQDARTTNPEDAQLLALVKEDG